MDELEVKKKSTLEENGWRLKPKLEGDVIYGQYVQRMAEELKKLYPAKPKPIRPDGMSEEDFIFSLQSKSTQDLLNAHKDPNYKRDWSAPLNDGWLANPEALSLDELIAKRELSLEEVLLVEDMRRKSKNELGQSEESAFSPEVRAKAAHAFLVSPPAELTDQEKERITNLTPGPKAIVNAFPEQKKKPTGGGWSIMELLGWKSK